MPATALGWRFFSSSFLQRPGPTVAASTGSPGCAGYTALAPTTTPNGRVPALRDCGLANCRRLHTACSEPARANCSVCLRLHWVGAFFLLLFCNGPAQLWLPQRVRPGARATLLWHPLLRRVVEYQHQVIVDLQTGVDCTQCAVSPPGSMCDPVLVAGWGWGFFEKRAGPHCYWHPLRSLHQRLGTRTQVQIARTWLKAGTEPTATRCSEPGRAICIVCLDCGG